METLLDTRAALLQALWGGPGYGTGLIAKVRDETRGSVRLARGNVYTALRALRGAGLVRSWRVVPGGRRGCRARVYYELTPKGAALAREQRRAIAGLVAPTLAAPSKQEVRLMAARIRRASAASRFALGLRDRLRRVAT